MFTVRPRFAAMTIAAVSACLPVAAVPASAQSATPAPSPAASSCAPLNVSLDRTTITATGSAILTVGARGSGTLEVLAYTQPKSEFQVVRRVELNDPEVGPQFRLAPPANTRLYARWQGCPADTASDQIVLNVRIALTLTATRNGTRDYTFAGDSLPARPGGLIVSLYRRLPDGREVLTAQARADQTTGEWKIRRAFTGTGRFGFAARTGQDLQNAPGASNVRSTLVY